MWLFENRPNKFERWIKKTNGEEGEEEPAKKTKTSKKEVSNNWNSIQFNIPRTISDFDNSDTSKHNFVAFQDKSAFKKVIDTGLFS